VWGNGAPKQLSKEMQGHMDEMVFASDPTSRKGDGGCVARGGGSNGSSNGSGGSLSTVVSTNGSEVVPKVVEGQVVGNSGAFLSCMKGSEVSMPIPNPSVVIHTNSETVYVEHSEKAGSKPIEPTDPSKMSYDPLKKVFTEREELTERNKVVKGEADGRALLAQQFANSQTTAPAVASPASFAFSNGSLAFSDGTCVDRDSEVEEKPQFGVDVVSLDTKERLAVQYNAAPGEHPMASEVDENRVTEVPRSENKDATEIFEAAWLQWSEDERRQYGASVAKRNHSLQCWCDTCKADFQLVKDKVDKRG